MHKPFKIMRKNAHPPTADAFMLPLQYPRVAGSGISLHWAKLCWFMGL